MKIRLAKFSDLPSIYNLVVELAVFEKEPEAVKATLEDYQEAFESGLISALVAELDDKVVGMALFYDTFSTWLGKMLYLEDFYVQAHLRGKGIGQALFKEVIVEAKRRNCRILKWQVLDWNTGAIKFYERIGATIEKQWYNGKLIFSQLD